MTTTTTEERLPASIRHRNPGAMGLGASAKRFGAVKNTRLNDGNTIATFPTSVDGAGALFHLLYTAYLDMPIWDAMHKWGDGRTLEKRGQVIKARLRTDGYISAIEKFSRFKRSDVLSKEMLLDREQAIEFGRAMSRHEAGREFPMQDAQWVEAHGEFLAVINGRTILLDRTSPQPVTAPLELAKTLLGERRIPGPDHNQVIVDLFSDVGSTIRNDDESYCAAGLGAMLKRTGHAYLQGAAGVGAKNYLNYGHALDEPEEGCIVVSWRESPSSWKGHVAFVESWTATHLTVVGFNQQGGAVTRMTVLRMGQRGSQVLGYRRPVAAVAPAREVLKDTQIKRDVVGGSISLMTLLVTGWGYIKDAAAAVGEFVGLLPDSAASASSAVSTGQSLFQSAGLPWPVHIGLLIVVASIAFNLYDRWQKTRTATGELTRPPYETDEAPSEDAEETCSSVDHWKFESSGNLGPGTANPTAKLDVAPARARSKKKPKPKAAKTARKPVKKARAA